MKTVKQKFLPIFADNQFWIVFIIFLVQLLFSLYRFFPTLQNINLWDEAVYINTGRLFANGTLTSFDRNPLIGLLYALTYLPFKNSPYWLMQSDALGRALLFGLMWWSGYLIAVRFRRIVHPLIFAGLLFCTLVLTDILDNPSDALFAAMSGFAFWKLLTFQQTRQAKDIGLASLFVGLAALSRNDGLVLFLVFVLISFVLLRVSIRQWRQIAAMILPFALMIGGYLALYRIVTGTFIFGTPERSYVAFQQGQVQIYQGDPTCKLSPVKCAVLEAQRLYGTPQENHYSVLAAILHNPGAFVIRIINTLKTLPAMVYTAYGKREAYLLFILAFLGIYELFRQRHYLLLGILLSWIVYLGVYFVTFFRIGYLQTPFFIPLTLAAVGVHSIVTLLENQRYRSILSFMALALMVVGLYRHLNYLYFNMIVLLAVVWIGYLTSRWVTVSSYTPICLIFLAAGLLVRGSYNPPQAQTWGRTPEEKAVVVLQHQLPANSLVASGAPGAVYAARMDYYGLVNIGGSAASVEELHARLLNLGVKAIYVDSSLTNQENYVWNLIKKGIGSEYRQIFSGGDGSIQVLLVNP